MAANLVGRLSAVLLGRRLANREQSQRRLGALEAIPAMGLDALGSSSYGPEAALTVLLPLGAASVAWIGWIMVPIVALLLMLFASYWQIIRAYPNNGGAYIVSKENLGTNLSLLAAAALMVDYVLNVAVGISAGVGALVSAVPELHPHVLGLCLGLLLLITVVNLRGTLDSGQLFALPTYLFVATFAIILCKGVLQTFAAGGHPTPLVSPVGLPGETFAVSAWLLLRAFAAGCTAMTGIEAVSNGISAFREPRARHAHRTLAAIVITLGLLLAGIAYLARSYRIGAMDQSSPGYRSVLAQLAAAVLGYGAWYYVAMGSVLCVLALSANTSFVAFPRLCRAVASDGFLPASFAVAGRRLVYSVGVIYLACTAGLLLLVFRGITDSLIPLFAIGAFLTFTLSQAGMVLHWRRLGSARTAKAWVNALGAVATGTALVVIVVAKFKEGAWITVIVMAVVIALLRVTHRYYEELGRRMGAAEPLHLHGSTPPVVLVVIESWNKLARKALEFGLSLSAEVVAVHLVQLAGPEQKEDANDLAAVWRANVEKPLRQRGRDPPRLVVLPAQRRFIHEPILKLVREIESAGGARRVLVVIPEMIKSRWYQYLLHLNRARRLRSRLLRHGGPHLVVIEVPWHAVDAGSASET